MTKSKGGNDMFGIPAEASEEGDEVHFTIHQIVPADPGWRAVFDDQASRRHLPVVCFALVEIHEQDTEPYRTVRPMVADELGRVDDVESFDDFVCLVPPGIQPQVAIAYAQKQQAALAEGDAEA